MTSMRECRSTRVSCSVCGLAEQVTGPPATCASDIPLRLACIPILTFLFAAPGCFVRRPPPAGHAGPLRGSPVALLSVHRLAGEME